MALPQKVIDQLGREPPKTPGWGVGILTFAGGVFFLTVLVYAGLVFGYEPYINNQLASVTSQIDGLAKSVSADDQGKLVTFYSEISNIQSVLQNHVFFSHFLTWLEKNTQANTYYAHVGFATGNQVALTGFSKTEADVNQQVALFEAAPEVKDVSVTAVTFSDTANLWQFTATLTMNPSPTLRATQ